MDFNKLTIKSQEAIAAAQELARRRGNPEIYPEHLLLALLDQELFADWQHLRAEAEQKLAARPTASGAQTLPQTSSSFREVLDRADRERAQLEDDYVSSEHLFLALEPAPRDEVLAWIKEVRGGQRVTSQDPEGTLPGPREVRPRPDRGGRGGQARPRDRPRRGDPARDPDPLSAHEEQPGADRRAGRRQDGDRRGSRAADRRRATFPRA